MSSEIASMARESAADIGRSIGQSALDPLALTEHLLEQAARHTGAGRAVFVRLTADRARREAAASRTRARKGLRRGPLDGVPVSWKDLFDMAGELTEAGAPRLAGRRATRDAETVARGARAGLVSLGKTHLSELAFSGLGYNAQTGTPPNRFDPDAVPGGSSAGAAASVGLGFAPAAIGTDTGGSVRIPAAWNGLVGLKTSAGRVSNQGVAPLSPSLDTVGPICRSVEDAALLFSILAGAPPPDLAGADPGDLRLAAAQGLCLTGMTEAGAAGYGRAVEQLRIAGARIHPIEIPEFEEALALIAAQGAIVNTEGWAVWGAAIEAQPDALSPMISARFQSGTAFRADQIEGARLRLRALSGAFQARLAGFDALLLPSAANRAPPLALIAEGGETAMAENLLALRNTRLANLFGLCALSLPAGLDAEGAPISLMLFGGPGAEARLLRLGAAVETALAPADPPSCTPILTS